MAHEQTLHGGARENAARVNLPPFISKPTDTSRSSGVMVMALPDQLRYVNQRARDFLKDMAATRGEHADGSLPDRARQFRASLEQIATAATWASAFAVGQTSGLVEVKHAKVAHGVPFRIRVFVPRVPSDRTSTRVVLLLGGESARRGGEPRV